jgi:hypothetical protein
MYRTYPRSSLARRLRRLRLGILPATRYPNPKNPDPEPNYPNSQYPKSSSDSKYYYPNLVWVIRVAPPGTRTTRNSVSVCVSPGDSCSRVDYITRGCGPRGRQPIKASAINPVFQISNAASFPPPCSPQSPPPPVSIT